MYKLLLLLILFGCEDPTPRAEGAQRIVHVCGTERWAVKTATDQYTLRGGKFPELVTTIDWLVEQPVQKVGENRRASPIEVSTLVVRNVRLIYYKKEDDQDYHLVITDGVHTMVVEAANPDCAQGSLFQGLIAGVYTQLTHLRIGKPKIVDQEVSIKGLGLFDKVHGQHGVAQNGIEIHPILAICFGHNCKF